MQELRWLQMTTDEIDDFLGTGGTGVLSFGAGTDESPASIPVSYGYNADIQTFYYRLSIPEGGKRETLVDRPVTFVTYEEIDDRWQSVVVTGRLDAVSDLPRESSEVQGMWAVQIPEVDIFERPRDEVSFQDFALEPETLSGRKEVDTE